MSSSTDRSNSPSPGAPFQNGNASRRHRYWGLPLRSWLVLAAGVFGATALILIGPQPSLRGFATEPFTYRVGERTEWEVRARVPFSQIDDAQTVHRRSEAAASVPPVFRVDRQRLSHGRERAERWLRALASPMSSAAVAEQLDLTQAQYTALHRQLRDPADRRLAEETLAACEEQLAGTGWLDQDTAQQFSFPGGELLVIADGSPQPRSVDAVDAERIFGLHGPIDRLLEQRLRRWPSEARDALRKLIRRAFLQAGPALVYDEPATEALRDEARSRAGAAILKFKPGTRIVGRGERITPEKLELLRREHERYRETIPWSARLARTIGALVLVAGLFFSVGFYVWRFEPRLRTRTGAVERLVATALAGLAAALLFHRWDAAFAPATIGAMILAVAYGPPFAVLITLAIDLCIAWAVGYGLLEFVVLAGATTGACFLVGVVRSRLQLAVAAVVIGAALFLLTWAAGFLGSQPLSLILIDSLRRFAYGAAAVLVLSALLPVVERLYGVTTRFTLLELSDAGHPLLQQLAQKAPGTYSHSQAVAVAAERAARAIGADPLLVRVGAYYHDVGKMFNSAYFIENNENAPVLHMKCEPALSARIIIGHVKKGVELARAHRLPEPVIDLIAQHHGTTLVEYFYHEARRESARDEDHRTEAEESIYRYPGPKPQTKEAGILMLADASESACRVLEDVTPARVQDTVRDIARRRLVDGQLDECDLTMREIRLIIDALAQALYSAAHLRVRYPESEKQEPALARR